MAHEIKIEDHSNEFLAAFNQATEAALEAIGFQAESYAKQNITKAVPRHPDSWYTPTGNLRNSITHVVVKKTVYIGTNNKYAIYNELGTGKYAEEGGRKSPWRYQDSEGNWHYTEGMKPIHFLKNAVTEHGKEYRQILEDYLKGSGE